MSTKQICISRDVRFYETLFPYHKAKFSHTDDAIIPLPVLNSDLSSHPSCHSQSHMPMPSINTHHSIFESPISHTQSSPMCSIQSTSPISNNNSHSYIYLFGPHHLFQITKFLQGKVQELLPGLNG